MNEDVVGYGLKWCSREIATGRMPIERVRQVWLLTSQPVDEAEFEQWRQKFSAECTPQAAKIARELWDSNRVFQPAMWGLSFKIKDGWRRWSSFGGKDDDRREEGGNT